jgi:hypothetical protein
LSNTDSETSKPHNYESNCLELMETQREKRKREGEEKRGEGEKKEGGI